MSFSRLNQAWLSRTGSPVAKLVLVALADHADESGKSFPSISRLVERTELSRTAVITGLKGLERSGHITIQRTFGRGSNYIVNRCATRTGTADAPVRQTHPTSAPDVPPPVRETHRTGTGDAPVTISNPQLNPQLTRTPSPSPRENVLSLEDESQDPPPKISAEDIYQAYPRHVGRKDGLKAIGKALKGISPETLLDHVRTFAAACEQAGTDPRFIPHPATWFTGERWEDKELPRPGVFDSMRRDRETANRDLASLKAASAREKQAPDYKTKLAQAEARVAQLEGRVA